MAALDGEFDLHDDAPSTRLATKALFFFGFLKIFNGIIMHPNLQHTSNRPIFLVFDVGQEIFRVLIPLTQDYNVQNEGL